jgi:two-component system chemotaxis response regulator CheB
MAKIRILIVDDSVVIRRLLSDCLNNDSELEVIGTAADGQLALAKVTQLTPDIVILDMEMPVLDGLQTLKAIRSTHYRLPVIMFSTLTERGAVATLDALSLGASDYVTKPANVGSVTAAMVRIRQELIPKIKLLCGRSPAKPGVLRESPTDLQTLLGSKLISYHSPEILAIGVSTGGPNALAALIPQLRKSLPVPVVIVQHMPPLFTRLLAERINAVSGIKTQEGVNGSALLPGEIWIAPGGFHMEVVKNRDGFSLHTHDGPHENSCRPAVDVLFRSVAQTYGARSLGVVLTGMGEDGLRGCECIREAGGQVLVQDEATSVVWGMPGAVSKAGLAEKVLPLVELAPEIDRRLRAGRDLPNLRKSEDCRVLAAEEGGL